MIVQVSKPQTLKILLISMITLAATIAIFVPAGLGWDFANFYDAGRRVASGQIDDLYKADRLIGGQPPQGKLGFYGTPISAYLYRPLAYFSPERALIFFKIQNTICFAVALLLLYLFLNDLTAGSMPAELYCFSILIFQPFWAIYRIGGQSTPTVFLLLTLAMLSHVRARFVLSAICFVVAVLIKPVFVIAFAFLFIVSPLRFKLHAAVAMMIAAVLSVALLGPEIHKQFLFMVQSVSKVPYPWDYNGSIYVLPNNLRLVFNIPDVVFGIILFLMQAGILVLFVKLALDIWKSRMKVERRLHLYFLLSILFCLSLALTVWEHYLSFVFFLLAYFLAVFRPLPRVLVAIFVLSIPHNMLFILPLREIVSFDSAAILLLGGFVKSAPLLLTLFFTTWALRRQEAPKAIAIS